MQRVVSAVAWKDGRGHLATLRKNFSGNLERLLQERGLKQRTFAEKVGVSESIVSKWINERIFPEDRQVDRISAVLGVTYEELFRDPDSTLPDPLVRALRDLIKSHGYDLVKKTKG